MEAWFDIIGGSLGFIGSVILSAGLLKTKEQIRDENKAYFNQNPYTTDAAISSQPYYVGGFLSIIAGFAIVIGGQIGALYQQNSLTVAILYSITIALGGYLGMALFLLHQFASHRKRRMIHRLNIFYTSVRTYAAEVKGLLPDDPDGRYPGLKEQYQNDLLEKYKTIEEPADEIPHQLIQAIDPLKTDPNQFVTVCERYLEEWTKQERSKRLKL